MRQPAFWNKQAGFGSAVLGPAAALWAWGARRRIRRGKWRRAGVPVVCVGNLVVGGAGKTPMAAAIAQRLAEAGMAPHIIARGYGGTETGPLRVKHRAHHASRVGDEALVLAAIAPTWVSRDRAAAAGLAVESGAEAVVLDDGHQDPSIARDFSLLAVDAAAGFGNGRVLPAGPMRERVADGLARADLVGLVGSPAERARFIEAWGGKIGIPIAGAQLKPLPVGIDWSEVRAVAFAGIGRPEKFFATLRGLGAEIAKAIPLSDHQPLSDRLLIRLERQARAHSAQLVTTEKDAARLPARWRSEVLTLPVRLEFDSWAEIDAALESAGLRVPGERGAEA